MQSLKKEIVSTLVFAPFCEGLENYVLTIITPAGIITGKPVSPEESAADCKEVHDTVTKIADDYRSENSIPAETSLDGNDGFFVLKDVQLVTGKTTHKFSTLIVFFDQITAISISEPEA